MKPTLILQNIPDENVREAFFQLLMYFDMQPLLNADFRFFELDIAAATTLYQLKHGLPFIPKDIIVLSAIGDQNFYFQYQKFDKTNLYLTNAGPVRIRFLAGNYQAPGFGAGGVEYPFVAPT